MWWGYSPALDLLSEINKGQDIVPGKCVEVLIVGASDARHIVKTLASCYKYPDCTITFHVIESNLEQVARSILLISMCLDKTLGLQEATFYYLDVLGNILMRPSTAKYLARQSNHLEKIPSGTIICPWLNLENLKHKDRDQLEAIFKFWKRAVCDHVPITEYWDKRIRQSLKTRYDYRDGVFDWDYYMVLKTRDIPNLTAQEYRFWRNNGIAFTWVECEPIRSNPTLLNNIIQHGQGFIHYAYLGDITNGPFVSWLLNQSHDKDKKYRATDIAEREVMRSIHEIKTKEPFCDELTGSHRDPSILNGIIVTKMPDNEVERQIWKSDQCELQNKDLDWCDLNNHKVVIHSVKSVEGLKTKPKYTERFDIVWVANNMLKCIPSFSPLLKKGSPMLVESRRYLVQLRDEDQQIFRKELLNITHENGLYEISQFNAEHYIAKFCKS